MSCFKTIIIMKDNRVIFNGPPRQIYDALVAQEGSAKGDVFTPNVIWTVG